MLTTIIVAAVLALISPYIAEFANTRMEIGRRKRSEARIESDKRFHVGASLERFQCPNSGTDIMGRCTITVLDPGHVELLSEDGKTVVSMTTREFEAGWPVVTFV